MIVAGWSIDRGRNYELDKTAPGTASITLIDVTGELDPTSPAYDFKPGTPAAIALRNPVTGTDHTVFRGNVTRLDYDLYQTERYATATLELVDGMDRLSRSEMIAAEKPSSPLLRKWGDIVPSESEGDVYFLQDQQSNAVANRINKVLDDAGWPSGLREVFSGNVSLQENVYATRTPALTAIQDAADAEFCGVANFYIQGNGANAGKATFHGRLARFQPADAQYHISTWRCGDMAAVAADSAYALIFELGFDKDIEKIINAASATPQNILDADIEGQYVEDTGSQDDFGVRSISFDNLLTAGGPGGTTANEETLKFATYYVDNYAQPRTRVNKVTIKRLPPGHANAARVWRLMSNVEISDIIRLKTTHQDGGFDEDFYVEGLHYDAAPLAEDYDDVTLTLDVSPASYYDSNPFS